MQTDITYSEAYEGIIFTILMEQVIRCQYWCVCVRGGMCVQTFRFETTTLNSLQIKPVVVAFLLKLKMSTWLCQMKWEHRGHVKHVEGCTSAPGGRWVQQGPHLQQQTVPSSWMSPDSLLWHCGTTYRSLPKGDQENKKKKDRKGLGRQHKTFCLLFIRYSVFPTHWKFQR